MKLCAVNDMELQTNTSETDGPTSLCNDVSNTFAMVLALFIPTD